MNPTMNLKASAGAGAGLVIQSETKLVAIPENFYHFQNMRRPEGCDCEGCHNWRSLDVRYRALAPSAVMCRNAFLAWEEIVPNIVTTEGKNDLLTKYLKGSGYTATWYVGLVDNAGFSAYAAGDTAAQIGGTNGWAEATIYTEGTRPAWTGGTAAAGSIDNSASKAQFSINNTGTIRGAFLVSNSTKGGTTGILYGEADFLASRSVLNGDTLYGTITCTV